MPSRHSTERGSAGSDPLAVMIDAFDPALPRSVPCLLGRNSGSRVYLMWRALAARAADQTYFRLVAGIAIHHTILTQRVSGGASRQRFRVAAAVAAYGGFHRFGLGSLLEVEKELVRIGR